MFIPNKNIVGRKVELLNDMSSLRGKFLKGSILTIVSVSPSGWDLEDNKGNRLIEIDINGHKHFKFLDEEK